MDEVKSVISDAMCQGDWRPIETAPRRVGKRIIVYAKNTVGEAHWAAPRDEAHDWYWSDAIEDWQMREYGPAGATHWMPLPKAPEQPS